MVSKYIIFINLPYNTIHFLWGGGKERVAICEWIQNLCDFVPTDASEAKQRNEYIQFIQIQLNSSPAYLIRPFNQIPPKNKRLAPLAEVLGNIICDDCPGLPRTGKQNLHIIFVWFPIILYSYTQQKNIIINIFSGPIHPVIQHESDDGKAFMTVKRCPHTGNVLCYMAVSSTTLISDKDEC